MHSVSINWSKLTIKVTCLHTFVHILLVGSGALLHPVCAGTNYYSFKICCKHCCLYKASLGSQEECSQEKHSPLCPTQHLRGGKALVLLLLSPPLLLSCIILTQCWSEGRCLINDYWWTKCIHLVQASSWCLIILCKLPFINLHTRIYSLKNECLQSTRHWAACQTEVDLLQN